MKIKLYYAGTAVLGAVLCAMLGACSDEVPAIDKNEAYTREFIKKYGVPDAESDWNAAARAEATVQGTMPAGAAYVQVFTADPMSPGAMLAAEYPAGKTAFKFDFAKKADKAYVRILDARRSVIAADYVKMSANKLAISRAVLNEDLPECTTTIHGTIEEKNSVPWSLKNAHGSITYNQEGWEYWWKQILGEERYTELMDNGETIKANTIFKTYLLDNEYTYDGTVNHLDLLEPIVGRTGKFLEQQCNMTRYRDEFSFSAEYYLPEGGPVSLNYFYGGTKYFNKLGYLYYKDEDKDDLAKIMRAPRFMIIDNATPQHNIYGGNTAEACNTPISEGMTMPTNLSFYEDGEDWMQKYYKGTTYQVPYFGDAEELEAGTKGVFKFPAGTHVIFFVVKNVTAEENDVPWKRSYSMPELNWLMQYRTGHSDQCQFIDYPNSSSIPTELRTESYSQEFVTYAYHGNTIMGIEDGTDHDVNDMMFFVNGQIDDSGIVDIAPDPVPQSWIVAVEDLGNTDDFDFNDIVFRVSHVSGTTEATVELLAAGGTLPANIYLKDIAEAIGTSKGYLHINEFFGESDHSVMINTTALDHTYGKVTIQVDPEFSMAETIETMKTNMGGFFVKVNPDDNTDWVDGVYEIHPKDDGEFSVPQMICIPDSWTDDAGNTVRWCWPAERISIESAYPRFRDWVKKAEGNEDWYKTVNENLVIKRTR